MSRGYRVFNIMQYEINPITGEDLHFNETNIISALSHKTFREWAYIYHDKDTYSQKDEDADRDRLSKEFDELSKQNPEIMEKVYKTNIERYGFKVARMNEDINKKLEQTNIERYGAPCVF